nr:MAG TPA: hypothetical protein [Caudoviricetes sp.]
MPVTLRLDSKHVASSHRIIPGLLLDKQSQNTGISPRKISMQRVAPSSWWIWLYGGPEEPATSQVRILCHR